MDRCDAVVPNLQTLRNNPSISEAVNNLPASYEGRVNSELSQGKQQIKKSGRYNLHDTVSWAPHLYHVASGKKRVVYDVTYTGHYISTLYITYMRHYISALFNLSFMFIHCHKR